MSQHALFPAKIDLLHRMLHWIRERLLLNGFDSDAIGKVELASEEALVNVIRHAYSDTEGTIGIDLFLHPQSHVEIIITDQGPPFNPLAKELQINPFASLEERVEGGLGILFMKQYMDEIRYERKSEKNILTLVKKQS